MAGENLGHNSREATGDTPFLREDSPENTYAPESAFVNQEHKALDQQLELDWGVLSSLSSSPSTKTLQEPITQSKSRKLLWEQAYVSRQTERIRHLEQALDQCQVYINELKLQLANQQFLEAQLAATEEMSHIQQQAIVALKTQLADQQDTNPLAVGAEPIVLEALDSRAIDQDRVEAATEQNCWEQQVADLQALLEDQQQQTEDLESQKALAQGLTVNLASQLGETQKQIVELQNKLSDRQATVTDLEAQLRRTKIALSTQQEITTALQQTQASESEKNKVIQGLSKNLLSAHTKIEALEIEFSNQLKLQAKLQHSCQELEAQASFYQDRTAELEQQVAEMQEQILHQAQQASEYEAAVQHWKERYLSAEHSVLQLKSVLEQLLKDRSGNLSELMASISSAEPNKDDPTDPAEKSSSDSEFPGLPKGLKVNLPGFLNLRRSHKS